MLYRKQGKMILRVTLLAAVTATLAACAGVSTHVDSPRVSLNQVDVQKLDLDAQTVLLHFDVTNPNPFPLPVRSLSYRVDLDGYRFASGESTADFTMPAQSDTAFAISAELDLLNTAPRLIQIIRQGAHRNIPYSLKGEFEVDVPFAPAVPFEENGTIRLFASN